MLILKSNSTSTVYWTPPEGKHFYGYDSLALWSQPLNLGIYHKWQKPKKKKDSLKRET